MPKTEKQWEQFRALCKMPRSQKQIENLRKLNERPRTQVQCEAGLRNLDKGRNITRNTIVEHHNDLCHGAERPDDITLMTSSEHHRLHANIRVQNGTHPFLGKNREVWLMK